MGKPTRKTSRMKPAIQVKIPATRVRASAGSTWVESSNSTAGPLVVSSLPNSSSISCAPASTKRGIPVAKGKSEVLKDQRRAVIAA